MLPSAKKQLQNNLERLEKEQLIQIILDAYEGLENITKSLTP